MAPGDSLSGTQPDVLGGSATAYQQTMRTVLSKAGSVWAGCLALGSYSVQAHCLLRLGLYSEQACYLLGSYLYSVQACYLLGSYLMQACYLHFQLHGQVERRGVLVDGVERALWRS